MSDDPLAKISSELRETREGTQTVIVRLSRATLSKSQTQSERVQTLRETARKTQQAVEAFASGREGVAVKNSFWIANAVVLEVDTERVSLREIAQIQGVRRIHENVKFEALDSGRPSRSKQVGESGDDGADSLEGDEYTYGLEQIDVPAVWEEHGTQGEGVKVAVLDTGIDADHETLDLFTEDPDDPTYPGGWAEWDTDGDRVEGSEPYESDSDASHGTHVSGTVAGGDESSRGHIGVAPGVDLLHGGVLTDESQGSLLAIFAALEWAFEQGADVVNMSLGPDGGGYFPSMIEPLENLQAAGVLPVSACGNDGEGTSGSPANVYGAGMAVGASDESEDIASFSSGEKVVTDDDWSGAEEDVEDWPDEYIVPDVSAPGVAVYSAQEGDTYGELPGTSMASPHVAGVAALMIAASDEVEPTGIWDVLEDTAWKPDGWDEGDAEWSIDGRDSRYGKGIVDAKAAVDLVALESGVEGTVTDASDSTTLEGVQVTIEDGWSVTTDEDGEYSILAEADEYTVSADTFGFESQSFDSVTVDEDEFTTQDFALDRELDGRVLAAQPDEVEGGDPVETTVETAHADTVTVAQLGNYDEDDADLVVDGDASATFDEPVSIDDGFTEVEISVQTTDDTEGEIELQVTLADGDGSVQVETGSTAVHEELIEVGVVDADSAYGDNIAAILMDELADIYHVQETTTNSVAHSPEEYDTVVVQKLDSESIADFVDATETTDIGVVYLDQWGNEANAIPQFEGVSDAVTATHENDNYFGDAEVPISYEATAEHPIIDEIPVGEEEVIHDGQYADITWFELASDSGFDVIADAKHGGGVEGSGLAIDEEKNTVLASTLGYSPYVGETEFTDAADTVLANAVSYLSEPQYDETTLEVSDDTIGFDETAYIEIDATLVDDVTVEYLWIDWDVDAVEGDGATFTNDVETDGTCTFSWNSTKDVADLVLSIAPNGDDDNGGDFSSDSEKYIGGTFLFTVTADGPETTIEDTAELELLYI